MGLARLTSYHSQWGISTAEDSICSDTLVSELPASNAACFGIVLCGTSFEAEYRIYSVCFCQIRQAGHLVHVTSVCLKLGVGGKSSGPFFSVYTCTCMRHNPYCYDIRIQHDVMSSSPFCGKLHTRAELDSYEQTWHREIFLPQWNSLKVDVC